jgi:hypothetical protein
MPARIELPEARIELPESKRAVLSGELGPCALSPWSAGSARRSLRAKWTLPMATNASAVATSLRDRRSTIVFDLPCSPPLRRIAVRRLSGVGSAQHGALSVRCGRCAADAGYEWGSPLPSAAFHRVLFVYGMILSQGSEANYVSVNPTDGILDLCLGVAMVLLGTP